MKPIVPKYFLRSLAVAGFILLVLLLWIHFFLQKAFKLKSRQEGFDKSSGFYFKLMEQESDRENLLSNHGGQEIVCVDNIEQPDLDRDMGLKVFQNWLTHLRRVNPAEVNEKLKQFELDVETNERISGDDIKRVYLAVILSGANTFLINNTGKHMSNKFDKQFIDVLGELCKNGKTILYLGSEPLEGKQKKIFFTNRQNQDFVHVDINKISLR